LEGTMDGYSTELERQMSRLYDSLGERDRQGDCATLGNLLILGNSRLDAR
jgi:hypothetical protein